MPAVLDFVEEANAAYLIIEYLPGPSLADLLKDGSRQPFPFEQVIEWSQSLCDLLTLMHAQQPPSLKGFFERTTVSAAARLSGDSRSDTVQPGRTALFRTKLEGVMSAGNLSCRDGRDNPSQPEHPSGGANMAMATVIREVFGRFQNLNLLALLADLGHDRTARHGWSSDSLLCPIAHGLADRQQVQSLIVLGHTSLPGADCDRAARCLGADPQAVLRFVRAWDEDTLDRGWLLRQLEALWLERLLDAEAVQAILHPDAETASADEIDVTVEQDWPE